MDVDDQTREIMERAKRRKAELESETKENKTSCHQSSPVIDKSAFQHNPINIIETNIDNVSELDKPKERRSVFDALADEYNEFAQETPAKTKSYTKENYIKGRSPRISIGETRASVLCAPGGITNSRSPSKQMENHISMSSTSPIKVTQKNEMEDARRIRFAIPIAATSTYYEESSRSSPSLNESSIVAGNLANQSIQSLSNSTLKKCSDEFYESQDCGAHLFIRKKTSSASSINVVSPQPFVRGSSSSSFSRVVFTPSATSSPKIEDTTINVDKTIPKNNMDTNTENEIISENVMTDVNPTPMKIANMLEERIKSAPNSGVPLPKTPIVLGYKDDSSVIRTQWRGTTNTPIVSCSTPGEQTKPDVRSTNIKNLRNRWEFSSSTGTPLHPDESEDALVQAALRMRDNTLPKKSFNRAVKNEPKFSDIKTPQSSHYSRSATSSPVAKSPRCEITATPPTTRGLEKINSFANPAAYEENIVTEDILDEIEDNAQKEEGGSNISRFIDDQFDFISPNKSPVKSLHSPKNEQIMTKNDEASVDESININNSNDDQDSKKESSLQYTISYYRKRTRMEQAPNPASEKLTSTCLSAPSQQIIGGVSFNQQDVDIQKKHLREIIFAQKTKVHQASKALQLCRNKEQFRGSHEEATAQWAVLIETEIGRAAENELQRISMEGIQRSEGPVGSLILSYISVDLDRDFVDTYSHIRSNNVFYFCIILRSAEQVLHSAIVSSEEAVKKGAIEIIQPMALKELPTNFIAHLDVYSFRTVRALYTHEEKFGLKGSTFKTKTLSRSVSHQSNSSDASFHLVGSLTFDINIHTGKRRLNMSAVHHPLGGQITIKIKKAAVGKCTTTRSGFLSMYQRGRDGLGSWNRYWCVLEEGSMKFWQRPEDEVNEKNWLVLLDLQTCADEKEGACVTKEPCQYMHSFHIDVWVPKEGHEAESLNRTGRPELEKLRVLLSADTSAEMRSWLEDINITAKHLLTWNRPYSTK